MCATHADPIHRRFTSGLVRLVASVAVVASAPAAIVHAQGPFPLFIPPIDVTGTTVVLANRGNPAPISCQIGNPASPYAGQQIAFEFGRIRRMGGR